MLDENTIQFPPKYPEALKIAKTMGFKMGSDTHTCNLLKTLAAAKPKGRLLEIGTGIGLSALWMLEGMDSQSTLLSVDNNADLVREAEKLVGADGRLTLHVADGAEFLKSLKGQTFDLIFADSWPGKYNHLEEALELVAPGGFYVIDDMLPQPNWPEDHQQAVDELLVKIGALKGFEVCKMNWSTGIVMCTRKSG